MRAGGAAGLLDAIAANGGSVERVLQAAGLSASDLADPDHWVDLEKVLRLDDAAAREVGDDAFGLKVGLTYDPNALGVLAYAVLNAPIVDTALRNFERYGHTHMEGAHIVFECRGGECRFGYEISVGSRELQRQNAEGACAMGMQLMRRLIGSHWRPLRVLFGHRRPADVREHERIFGAPLAFDQDVSCALVFEASDLERSVVGADPRLLPIVQRYLDDMPAPASASDAWLCDVRGQIARAACDGHPELERIARRLGMAGRTLQRRLAERGLVWKRLVEDVRRELALRYLNDTLPLTQVAFLLGYSELSAFYRAFRRWTGTTPAEYRRRAKESALENVV
jgi:AraC-like DNA-binding protein